MQGSYLGPYPWKNGGVLTAEDLNAAIALALSPVSVIPPGSIGNVSLATPWVQIGTTRVVLGTTVNTLNGVIDPTNDLDVANKHYVDQFAGTGGGGGGIPDAPADTHYYGRFNAGWAQVVPLVGGVTITGTLGTTGMLTASNGITVNGGGTLANGLVISSGAPPLILRQAASTGMPAGSGGVQATSLVVRLVAGASGPTLDIGTNGVSGTWLEVTNTADLTQHYPLLLQPIGGETRVGGALNVTAGNLAVTGNISATGSFTAGALNGSSLALTTPLSLASGGTNSTSQPLPANLPGRTWASALVATTGSAIVPAGGAAGYMAKTAGYSLDMVGVANTPVLFLDRVNGTLAAPAAIALNDVIGGVYGNGYTGSAVSSANPGAIQITATQAWTPTAMGTQLLFWTTPNNYNTPSVALTLGGDGSATLRGALTAGGDIHTSGNIYATGPYLQLGPGGSTIQADANNMNFFLPGTTGQFAWYDINAAHNFATLNANGLTLPGSGNVINVPNGGIAVSNGTVAAKGLSATSVLTINGLNISRDGLSNVYIDAALRMSGAYFYFLNAQGAVNTTGGPLIYADNSNMIFKQGSGNSQWAWQNWAGGSVTVLNAAGDLTLRSINAAQGAIFGGNTSTYFVVPASDNAYGCGNPGQAWNYVTSYSYITSSDARVKTDFAPLPDCLDLVAALQPQRYRLTSGPEQERVHWGFIAQDVGAVMAAADHKFGGHIVDDEGRQALNYNELVAVLWKATQELRARVAALEAA